MLNRRAGEEYIKYMIIFENSIKKLKIINTLECIRNIITRLIVSIVPNGVRKFIYNKKLREKSITDSKNVAFIINYITNGGPSNVVLNIIKEMKNSKFTPILITLFDENDERIIKELDIKVIQLKYKNRIDAILNGRKRINNIIQNENIDIVHSNGFIPDIISSELKNVKKLSTIHCNFREDYNNTYGRIKGRIYEKIQIIALKKYDFVIGCSKTVFEYMKMKNINKNIYYIRNGVTTKELLKTTIQRKNFEINEKSNVFIYVGGINRRKRVYELIEQFKKVHKKNDYLMIVGEGEEKIKCKEIANDNIIFVGFVKNVKEYLKIANFYVSYSSSEGMSIAIIEALEEGLPLLLSDIPSHKEIFGIDRNYYIGEIFNEDFSSKYECLKNKNDKDNKNNIIEFQNKYLSSNSMANGYFKIYEKL